jgi:hypothetical protein
MPATCPTGSIQSFPLKLGFRPTSTDYEHARENIHLDVNWAPRTTTPVFNTDEAGYTDEGTSELTTKTTVRYNGRTYRLLNVQVCESTHTEWILPAVGKDINKYDFIVTFQAVIDTTSKYLMLIMPLLSTGAIDPNYLAGLVNTADANTVYSLKDCFPNSDANFAIYSTCLIPTQANASYKTMDIFICYDGTQITADMQTALDTALPTGAPYSSTVDSGVTKRLSSLANQGDLGNMVITTTSLLNPKSEKRSVEGFQTARTEDDLSAYKCVPFDPDVQIKKDANGNGEIILDTKTGVPLSKVEAERQALREERTTKASSTMIKIFEPVIGILLAVIVVIGICYVVLTTINSPAASFIPYLVAAIAICVASFIGGIYTVILMK